MSIKMDMHIHSNFSDGLNSPEEIVQFCIKKNYKVIGLVDHVRRNTMWLDSFCQEIDRLRAKYSAQINVVSGIECKVLNLAGKLDAKPSFLGKVDLVVAAFHQLPAKRRGFLSAEAIAQDKDYALNLWYEAMLATLDNPAVNVIAHPTAILQKYGIRLSEGQMKRIATKAKERGKIFEVSAKYDVPDAHFLSILKEQGVRLWPGSDSHSLKDIGSLSEKYEQTGYPKLRVAFRVSGGIGNLGTGHVVRCSYLAEEMKEKYQAQCLFVMEDYPEGIVEVRSRGFAVRIIPRQLGYQREAEVVENMLQEFDPHIVIVDIYRVKNRLLHRLRDGNRTLVAISDLKRISLDSDIVINGFIGLDETIEKNRFEGKCFLGTKFLILDKRFSEYRSKMRGQNQLNKNILVTMGGEDRLGLTLKVIRAIVRTGEEVDVTVILGPAFKSEYKEQLEAILPNLPEGFTILETTDNMPEVIRGADIAICAAGMTAYELLCLGIPSIVIAQAYHQLVTARELEAKGLAVNLGIGSKLSERRISEAIKKLLIDGNLRKELSERGKKAVDGEGIKRTLEGITNSATYWW